MRRLALALLFAAPVLSAQSYTAKTVEFSDKGLFTQAQLEAASGLHPGSTFTAKGLADAAARLNDTGFFDQVSAQLEGKVNAVTVRFTDKPTPANQMLHVGFRNFVWLTQAEIDAAILARIPLYAGYLPENSPLDETVKTTLQEALARKSVVAQTAFETFEPTLNHPLRELVFEIKQPTIQLSNVHLTGVSPALASYVQKSVNSTAHTRYVEGPANSTTEQSILEPLLDAGYAAATLSAQTLTPEPPTPDGIVNVVLSARLNPGEIFHVSSLTFPGSSLLSPEAFAATQKLHPGDLASHKLLLETLAPLDAAYRARGYMDVVVDAHPALDSSAHTVAYNITVVPGEQYRIHEVTTNGLTPAAKADFDRGFLLKPGELYNPGYFNDFLKNNTALRALEGYSARYKAYADPTNHTVDVVMDFYPMRTQSKR